MIHIVTKAIASQHRLVINYPPGVRIIEPHAVGYSKDGNILLRAYQVEGASASGEHEHWKLFRLDRMISMHTDFVQFDGPREGYRQGDKAMKGGIISELPLRSRKAQAQ